MKTSLKVLGWLIYLIALQCLMSCDSHSDNQEKKAVMNSDVVALQRFIKLPADVDSCEWQTGEFAPGGDWWLAATFKVKTEELSKFLLEPPNKELVEIPSTLQFEASFAELKSLPSAGIAGSNSISFIADVYPVTPYESSPLLNGKVIKLSDHTVFILLWTL